MKRFILVTDSPSVTNDARNAITAFLEAKGWSVWHWFEDLWLVDGAPAELQPSTVRKELTAILPHSAFLIMTTEGEKGHAGQVPKEAIPWLTEHWHRN